MSARTIIPKSSAATATNMQTRFHTNLASSLNPPTRGDSVPTYNNAVIYNHVPLPDEPAGLYDTLLTESDMALSKRKFVKVYSIGELEVEPDQVEFCIKIQSCKADIEQSRDSVQKREDYVLGILRKFKVKQGEYSMFTMVKKIYPNQDDDGNENNFTKTEKSRRNNVAQQVPSNDKEGDGKKEKLELTREICVKCDSLVKYMHIFSMCNEKLDHHVIVSQPVVRFSPAYVQVNTQKAVNLAMSNGILKANEMISSFKRRLTLGRLYYSVEDSFKIEEIEDHNKGMPNNFETFSWRRQNKMYRCNLTSVFELETAKSRKII